MIRKLLITLQFTFFIAGICLGQFTSTINSAHKDIKKGQWSKASQKLKRALVKDSLDAAITYAYSQYYFNTDNPQYNLDSAHYYINQALIQFKTSSKKRQERLQKDKVDTLTILQFRKQIDSAAFERAKQINTEGAFVHFLTHYPHASQQKEAIQLRDEAAFQNAETVNTYQSFLSFLEKYPKAVNAAEAKRKYERLLYESKTKERTLESYQRFLEEHPASLYRREIERHIFEISTASGEVSGFVSFLQRYPGSSYAPRARDILFYILAEHDDLSVNNTFLNDSLHKVAMLNEGYLIPVLDSARFGFMNNNGKVIMQPQWTDIPDEYKCGNVTEDVLVLEGKLIARDGTVVYTNAIESVENIGLGYLKVVVQDCISVIHKSGFVVSDDCIDDAKIVSGKFIALQKGNQWSLVTLSGRSITPYSYNKIEAIKGAIALKVSDQVQLTTPGKIGMAVNQIKLIYNGPYDEARPWNGDGIWIRTNSATGVLNSSLEIIIPESDHELKQAFFGTIARTKTSSYIYSTAGELLDSVENTIVNEPWVAVKKEDQWRFLNVSTKTYSLQRFDTVSFAGPFAIGITKDSVTVIFNDNVSHLFTGNSKVSFIPSRDLSAFLMVSQGKRKLLYDHQGIKRIVVEADNIQYAGLGYFIIWKNEKKGLIDRDGKMVLPIEYDAIGNVSADYVTLLKNTRFGIYNLHTKKLIKPQYEKNLIVYNNKFITAFEKGSYGIINWENKSISKFEFAEVRYWNDTLALVKHNSLWRIYDLYKEQLTGSGFKELKLIIDSPEEQLAIIHLSEGVGVLSNKHGFVLPPTFTHVSNLGTTEEPFYFTERHVEEASVYIIRYYDKNGKMLLQKVYDEDDYEKIFCQ